MGNRWKRLIILPSRGRVRGGFQLHNEVMRERIGDKRIYYLPRSRNLNFAKKKKTEEKFSEWWSESTDLKEIKNRTSKKERSIITYCAAIEGKTPSCPLGTTCYVSQEKFLRSPYSKSFINPACSVKMIEIGPSIFVCLLTSTPSRSIKTQGKKLAQYIPGWGSLIWAI